MASQLRSAVGKTLWHIEENQLVLKLSHSKGIMKDSQSYEQLRNRTLFVSE